MLGGRYTRRKRQRHKPNPNPKPNPNNGETAETDTCKGLSFADCELAILRMAVDKAENKMGKRAVESGDIKKIIAIVEDFIKAKSVICYGGTAINNILPEKDKFYDKDVELPDYDFLSLHAVEDAKELADIYFNKGFTEVEAKAGQHHGTFKVFVNYFAVADITFMPKSIFDILKKEALRVDGILYAPPNFLRMSMYLELSRPAGDTSRWEKVMKRLSLLNKNYPITNVNCYDVDFQRGMSAASGPAAATHHLIKTEEHKIFEVTLQTLLREKVVFFGGYANLLYSRYMPAKFKHKLSKETADFDVLSNSPKETAEKVKASLLQQKSLFATDRGSKGQVKIVQHTAIGEIVPEHYEVQIGGESILFIYKPVGCHSYNTLEIDGKTVRVATIDTMLSFYLAFLYADKPYYNQFTNRILCMSKFLFDVQQKNRLSQKGLLKRFSITCYGHQESVEEMKAKKAKKYRELSAPGKKNSPEYEEWFLNYKPSDGAAVAAALKPSTKESSAEISKTRVLSSTQRRQPSATATPIATTETAKTRKRPTQKKTQKRGKRRHVAKKPKWYKLLL